MEPWKVKMAMDFKCPTCDGLRPGGMSSGNIPPAATHAQFGPWEAVGLDVAEWYVPMRPHQAEVPPHHRHVHTTACSLSFV